jgi:hypothetical protein
MPGTYKFTLTGITPLLLHADSIEWADQMEDWKNNPDNKSKSRAGDDRTPAFRWIGCLHMDGEKLVIPADNIARALMSAGARVPVPGGKGGKTFKQDTMASMFIEDAFCPLYIHGKTVPQSAIEPLKNVGDYSEHRAAVAKLGFELFAKRAKVGMTKHIRVRPRFDNWACSGTVQVIDEKLERALPMVFDIAGSQMGLGDWRPSGRTPGPFGRFKAEVKRVG